MINPPTKKNIVAMIPDFWSVEIPVIECPEVHPFAYRVPKPTKIPPANN